MSYTQNLPIISDQIQRPALEVVLSSLDRVLQDNIDGTIVEFGCYIGTTSLFIRRLLDQQNESVKRTFHVYDSFEGLPPKRPQDMSAAGVDFKAGELSVTKKQFVAEFKKAHLQLPVIHRGWFADMTDQDVPEEIAFAFLDGDFYDSMIDSLRLVWPRLSPGGIVCFDDYDRETLPGVKRAVCDYFQSSPELLDTIKVNSNIAVLRKPL